MAVKSICIGILLGLIIYQGCSYRIYNKVFEIAVPIHQSKWFDITGDCGQYKVGIQMGVPAEQFFNNEIMKVNLFKLSATSLSIGEVYFDNIRMRPEDCLCSDFCEEFEGKEGSK